MALLKCGAIQLIEECEENLANQFVMNHLLGTVKIIVAVRIQQLVEKNVKNGPPNFHIDIILQVWEIITTVVIQMALLKCGAIQLIEKYEENLVDQCRTIWKLLKKTMMYSAIPIS